jgi:hypothetical protein
MQEEPSKRVRGVLREAMGEAYRRELDRELEKLAEEFARWRRGEMSPFELSDRIHQFHQGPNRELFARYTAGNSLLLLQVAGAVRQGVLRLEEIHPDAWEHVKGMMEKLEFVGGGTRPRG